MSNIIKRVNVLISEAKMITFPEPEPEEETLAEAELYMPEFEVFSEAQVTEEESEPALTQQDLDSIIQETEDMIKDLLEKARQEAHVIIENAQEEAEKILYEAQRDSVQLKEQARNEGYENGLKEAHEAIESDRQMALEQAENILMEARRNKVRILESSVADMTRLTMMIAKKILATELKINPNIIVNIIREAVSYLDHSNSIQVYLNPEDLEKVTVQIVRENLNESSRVKELELLPDKRLEPGGCIIESDGGSIDAQLETRIGNVEKAIWEVAVDDSNEIT